MNTAALPCWWGRDGVRWEQEWETPAVKATQVSSGSSVPGQLSSRGYKITTAETESKKVKKCLLFHRTHKKRRKKEKAFWLGPQLLSFHCLWPRTCRCLSRHLAKALKCVRSLLGLNDNRNHPSWEGNLFIWWPFIKWQVFLQDFLQWDISNQLGALPSLYQLLVFECHKTKSCEIKPAAWAMKMGCWDETVGPSHIISVHHYDANYGKHY